MSSKKAATLSRTYASFLSIRYIDRKIDAVTIFQNCFNFFAHSMKYDEVVNQGTNFQSTIYN